MDVEVCKFQQIVMKRKQKVLKWKQKVTKGTKSSEMDVEICQIKKTLKTGNKK